MNAPLDRRGLGLGIAAYGLWGVLPIYFKALAAVPAVTIVAHRIAWSVPFLALLVMASGRSAAFRQVFASSRTLAWLALTALLIGVNWLLYVYAVTSGQILAGSLGYYLNPLANVLLGRLVLKERLAASQWAAVIIAAAGIAPLAWQAAGQLWISLALCVSFASYGLLRKLAPVDAVVGLTVETVLLLPLALGWLALTAASGTAVFGRGVAELALILLSGTATAIPLLLFTAAARRLPYSTLGMLQFLAPTMQFLIAVLVYGEAFTLAHQVAFGAIWIALALYVGALRRKAPVPTLPE